MPPSPSLQPRWPASCHTSAHTTTHTHARMHTCTHTRATLPGTVWWTETPQSFRDQIGWQQRVMWWGLGEQRGSETGSGVLVEEVGWGGGLFFILGETLVLNIFLFPLARVSASWLFGSGVRNRHPSIPTWAGSASISTTRKPQPPERPPSFTPSCYFPQS